MMKIISVTVFTLFIMTACMQPDDAVKRNLNSLNSEIAGMQSTISDMQMELDDLEMKNDSQVVALTSSSDMLAELKTELAYLRNELLMLKSARTQPITSPIAQNNDFSSTSGTTVADKPATPKIVIIEDNDSVKSSLYSYAFELYRQGNYADSIAKFQEFLAKFPNDELAVNAQYWIGEGFYSLEDFPKALAAFQDVVKKFPRGSKVPDAHLKIGYTFDRMGDRQKAKDSLNALIKAYPSSPAASLAKQTLAKWNN